MASSLNLRIEALEPLLLMSASSIDGSDAGEWLSGLEGDDLINAGGGNDEIHDALGNNIINGGTGIDTFVVYQGDRDDYQLRQNSNGDVVLSGLGLNGTKTSSRLINIEQIRFNDELLDVADLAFQNSAPTARFDWFPGTSNEVLTGNVLRNDSDPDGDSLQVELKTPPSSGQLTLLPDGSFQFTPSKTRSHLVTFSYSVTDGFGESDTTTAYLFIRASANKVAASPSPLSQTLLDSDSASDDPIVTAVASQTRDQLAPTNDASNATTQLAMPSPEGPQAIDDSYEFETNRTLFGNVGANDSRDPAIGSRLTFELIDAVADGSLNFYSDGSFDYFANELVTDSASFTYRATDTAGNSSTADVVISPKTTQLIIEAAKPVVTTPDESLPAPPLPGAKPTAQLPEVAPAEVPASPATDPTEPPASQLAVHSTDTSRSVTASLMANHSETASVVDSTNSQFGTASVSTDGTFTYEAAAGFRGIDYFHYTTFDGQQTDRSTVVIHVGEPTPTQVWASSEMVVSPIVVDLNNDGIIGVTGVTTAKLKPEGAEIGATVQFDIDADGTLETIEWIDGSGDGILVDTSQFYGDQISGLALFGDEGGQYENGFEKLRLLDTDGSQFIEGNELSRLKLWVDDGDGNLASNELDTLQQHGIFTISTRMTLTSDGLMRSSAFTSDDMEVMIEDVWFAKASDPNEPSAHLENRLPDADPDVFEGRKDTVITGNVLSNDSDPDGDSLLVTRSTKTVHGRVTISDDGNFSYTPDEGFVGVDYFQYEVSDVNGGRDTAVVTLAVSGNSAAIDTGSTIAGTVWHDVNADGLAGDSENSKGTSVFISLLDDTGRILQSTHTNSDGTYQFDGLANGDYRIQVAANSLPSVLGQNGRFTLQNVNGDFFNAIDSDVNQAGLSELISIKDNESPTGYTVDAGFAFPQTASPI